VTVKRPDLSVRARKGYFLTQATLEPKQSRQLDLANALQSPVNFSALPLQLRFAKIEPSGGKRKVLFEVYLGPNVVTIDSETSPEINLDFIADVRTPTGESKANTSQTIGGNLQPLGVQQLEASGMTYRNSLEVAAGDYTFHLVVRDNLSGKLGNLVVPLHVAE
jgi:hypothetical protein